MSISALTLAMYHSKATYSTRLVLIAIANFEGEDGAWPSLETVGRLAGGLNRRTVQRSIDELVNSGELIEVRRMGETNKYKVAIRCPEECDGSTQHRRKKGDGLQTAPTHQGVANDTQGGGVQTAGGVVSRPPESLLNPIKNLRTNTLPRDWEPDESLMAMFQTKWPDIDPNYHIEQFKLYYWGTSTKNKDWSLTFQRWMNQEQARAKSQPWRGGGANTESAKAKKSSEREATLKFLAEQAELEKQAAPAPKCKHGKNIALCNPCLRELEDA